MGPSDDIEILDVVDERTFGMIPPCADPGFDHRSCDYWEDADRGSKAARLDWLEPVSAGAAGQPEGGIARPARPPASNPFLDDLGRDDEVVANPFATAGPGRAPNPFLLADDEPLADNPFAPRRAARPDVPDSAPRKLRLLGRGLGVAGSYAKVLVWRGVPAAYSQFGPLTAYPRAQRTRDLYPALPDAPLPAVITCIATTREARDRGLARRLVEAVCADLAERGFAAVETYPAVGVREDATSAATPAFWLGLGFEVAAPDERFPVMRRALE